MGDDLVGVSERWKKKRMVGREAPLSIINGGYGRSSRSPRMTA